eukprot:XP_001691602.1 predicted protein [Chlamydomonas reinhardtii]
MVWLVNAIFVHGEELLLETEEEENGLQAALERIPKHRLASERLAAADGRFTSPQTRDGIPEGVDCDPVERCDSRNVCARVCARGSVRLDPWLQQAVAYQPLCLAQLLGTHNSAITLADGYGMHDELYTSYLRYLNLVLSLTDQLNLGVRLFSDAVAEVAAWLAAPGNEAEFIVLYLDDQMDLATWGRVPELLAQVTAAFPRAAILTPPELADLVAQGGSPPSIESLVSRHGKRLLLMSAADYGAAMSHTAFNHSSPCGLAEPLFQPQLDSELLPGAVSCGINVPAPDLLTPDLLAAAAPEWLPAGLAQSQH